MNDICHDAKILVEVCVGSVADVAAAATAGADRVELCGALELGGLTPSLGLVESVLAATKLPVVAMLRPRAGGFAYDRNEFAAMLRDAERFLDLGVQGLVFGVLDRAGRVDASRCRALIDQAVGAQTVFHRAFDFVSNARPALEELCRLGCTRVLTSGGQHTALAGAPALRGLIQAAAGRIEILPGGGINDSNVAEVARSTRCRQIHIGASVPLNDGSLAAGGHGIELVDRRFMQGGDYRTVSAAVVAATIQALCDA